MEGDEPGTSENVTDDPSTRDVEGNIEKKICRT